MTQREWRRMKAQRKLRAALVQIKAALHELDGDTEEIQFVLLDAFGVTKKAWYELARHEDERKAG